mgnify:CR=1 FL=1
MQFTRSPSIVVKKKSVVETSKSVVSIELGNEKKIARNVGMIEIPADVKFPRDKYEFLNTLELQPKTIQ